MYTAGESGGDTNVPTIRTTVTNTENDGQFDVFAYFWSDGDQWAIQAGFDPNDLTWVREQGADQAQAAEFTADIVTADGELRLYQVYLGRVDLDLNEDLSVYIDLGFEMSTTSGNYTHAFGAVTYYDGIGLAKVTDVVPEPTPLSLFSAAALALMIRPAR